MKISSCASMVLATLTVACATPPVVPSRRVIVVDATSTDQPTPAECARHCASVVHGSEVPTCEGARLDIAKTYMTLHQYIATVCILTQSTTTSREAQ